MGKEKSSGDIVLVFKSSTSDGDDGECCVRKVWCHSFILTQHPYFFKMLHGAVPLREGRLRELTITDPPEDFLALLKYIYTGQLNINLNTAASLMMLADKYCIDDALDQCLKFIKDNFDADMFYAFFGYTIPHTSFRERLLKEFLGMLRHRNHLCSVTVDRKWQALPIEFVEELLSSDDLPVTDESEVITLIARWVGGGGCTADD